MKLKEKGPVSVSRLQKFERCPWSYYLQYDLGKPEPSGEFAEFGKLVHTIISEAIYRNCAGSTNEAFDVLAIDIAAGELEFIPEGKDKNPGKETAELWQKFSDRYDEIKGMTLKALNLWRSLPPKKAVLEKHFQKPLPCGVELQGYIDLMCGVNMWDWKAGHNIKSYMQSPQLALYTWGVAKQDPDKAQRAYVFLALDDPIFVDRYPIAKAVEWANDLCLQIEFAYEIAEDEGPEAAFPKNPGAACRLCGFKDICSEETKAENGIVIPESVVTQEEAAKLAETILNLENILKQAQEKLTDYCKTNGAFELNGEWFGIYPGSVRKEWDTQKLYELVAQFPLEDIIPILSINSRGIDKFLKKYPALKGDVEKLVTEKPGNPSFKHQKTPPKEPGKVA